MVFTEGIRRGLAARVELADDDGDDDDDGEAETEGLLNVIVSWIIFAGWKHQSITSNGRKY